KDPNGQGSSDRKITSLFVRGIEDDLPEHHLRTFFARFGALRSLVCSHRAHCAFVNYVARGDAERAAAECRGRAVVQGVPLRVSWGKPKPLDEMDRGERIANARAAREARPAAPQRRSGQAGATGGSGGAGGEGGDAGAAGEALVAPPPGQEKVAYASLRGD
ncbi:Pre-mRNA-splicing factor slt11, partial [Ascosphaera acerosa]